MSRTEFLSQLRRGLFGLPQNDIEERLAFYNEMIEDQMEDGLSEEAAVLAVGTVDEIVAQVLAETPFLKIAKERIRPSRRLNTGEILLIVLGSPIWLPLGIAALSVVLSLYISLWSVVISIWSIFAAFVGCFIGGTGACILFTASGNGASGLAMLAAGLVCAGFAIFMFYGCRAVTKGMLILTKKTAIWAKNCFRRKDDAE